MSTKELIKKNLVAITFQVVGFFVVVLNLYLANTLAPLSENIAKLNQRVLAIEEVNKNHITQAEFNQLIRQVDSISVRLDQLIARSK